MLSRLLSIFMALLIGFCAVRPVVCLEDILHQEDVPSISHEHGAQAQHEQSSDSHGTCCKSCNHQVFALGAGAVKLNPDNSQSHFQGSSVFLFEAPLVPIDHPPAGAAA
jgi:hypothetical protein